MTFASLAEGATFILDWDGCCYMKINGYGVKPGNGRSYSIPGDSQVFTICECKTRRFTLIGGINEEGF